ncbi:MAG: hypothetical protein Q9165_007377 [Trypethelium subeluteriae]
MKLLNIFLIYFASFSAAAKSQSTIVDAKGLMFQSVNRKTGFGQFYQCSSICTTGSEPTEVPADPLSYDIPVPAGDLELYMTQDHSRTWAVVAAEQILTSIDEVKRIVSEVNIGKLPSDASAWVQANPTQAVSYAIWGVSVFTLYFPGSVSGSLLTAIGFPAEGPKARSIAAFAQSKMTRVVAKGIFAHLQSAKTESYGLAAVNAVTRFGIGVSNLASHLPRNWREGFASGVDHPKLAAQGHSTESS